MVTLQELADFTKDRQSDFCKMENRLLDLTVSKFFEASNEKVIDFELVNYVSDSKLKVDGFDRVAIINIALSRLLGDDNFYFEDLLKENNFQNIRSLTSNIIGWW